MLSKQTHETAKQIKQSFRLLMNGDASRSMREKGLNYKLNWGISVPELKRMASKYGKNYNLAVELWNDDVRECRLLATLIMPAEQMLPELVDVWMETLNTYELAEQLVHNLLQHLSFAPVLAFEWIADEKPLWQYTGYLLLAKLFARGQEPNERGINEFLDQAQAAIDGSDVTIKRAAFNCVQRFCDLGEPYETIARKALKIEL